MAAASTTRQHRDHHTSADRRPGPCCRQRPSARPARTDGDRARCRPHDDRPSPANPAPTGRHTRRRSGGPTTRWHINTTGAAEQTVAAATSPTTVTGAAASADRGAGAEPGATPPSRPRATPPQHLTTTPSCSGAGPANVVGCGKLTGVNASAAANPQAWKHASARFRFPAAGSRSARRGRMARCRRSRVPATTTYVFNGVGCSVFLNNRYHDPQLGHFVSVDPLVGQTGMPYMYGNGNPTTLSDPTGLAACEDDGNCSWSGTVEGYWRKLQYASDRWDTSARSHTRRNAIQVVPDGGDDLRFEGVVDFGALNNECDSISGCLFTTQTIIGRGGTSEAEESTDWSPLVDAILTGACSIPLLSTGCNLLDAASMVVAVSGELPVSSSESALVFQASATVLTVNWMHDVEGNLIPQNSWVGSQSISLTFAPSLFKPLYDSEVASGGAEGSRFRLAPPIGATTVTEAVGPAWTDSSTRTYTGFLALRTRLVDIVHV